MSTITITYNPPGAEPKTWDFNTEDWTFGETVEIERLYGATRREFFNATSEGSDTARQILVWMVRRRTELNLTLDDLDTMLPSYLSFSTTAPDVEPGKDEADPTAVQE